MNREAQSIAFLSHYFDADAPIVQNGSMIVKVVCPFHDDTLPSLWVYVDQATAHCYACGWHGTITTAIEQMEKVSSLKALRLLRSWASGEMREAGEALRSTSVRVAPFASSIDEQLKRLSRLPLLVDSESKAEQYMYQRGFEEETLRFFDVRYDRHYQDGEWPVCYPILQWPRWEGWDANNGGPRSVLCWQRRRIDAVDTPDKPKYKWSVGAKFSTYIAGWLSSDVDAVMTEGYLDMMMAWQHLKGSRPVCSPLTWLLRSGQANQIKHRSVIGALDNDDKGREGIERASTLVPNFTPFDWDCAVKDIGAMDEMEFTRELTRALAKGRRRRGRQA